MVLNSAYCNWLQFATSCLFHSVCVSLRGLRSYAVTYVNFKIHLSKILSCQVTVSHFVTLTQDSAAPGSQSSRIVVQRLEEIFCIMEESLSDGTICCLCTTVSS